MALAGIRIGGRDKGLEDARVHHHGHGFHRAEADFTGLRMETSQGLSHGAFRNVYGEMWSHLFEHQNKHKRAIKLLNIQSDLPWNSVRSACDLQDHVVFPQNGSLGGKEEL